MYKIVFFTVLLSTFLYAQEKRPELYSSIGEGVYESAYGYKELLHAPYFLEHYSDLKTFISQADTLREEGLLLDKESSRESRANYVKKLRVLSNQSKQIELRIESDLKRLWVSKNYNVLKKLKTNPLPYIKDSIAVRSAVSGVVPQENDLNIQEINSTITEAFTSLKQQLLNARIEGSEKADCLNDMTAMLYWMQKVDGFHEDYCKAGEACEQVSGFMKAAKDSCTKEDPLYVEWSARSLEYRTTMRDMYAIKCDKN